MSKSLRARNAAKRSLQAKTSQKYTPRPPKRGSPVALAKAAADAHALVNVPNGVRIVGLPESYATKLFGKDGTNAATLQSIDGCKAYIRTKYGTFAVLRRLVKSAAAPIDDMLPDKSLQLSYPARTWRELAPGLEILE
jgi:hypothetical protein